MLAGSSEWEWISVSDKSMAELRSRYSNEERSAKMKEVITLDGDSLYYTRQFPDFVGRNMVPYFPRLKKELNDYGFSCDLLHPGNGGYSSMTFRVSRRNTHSDLGKAREVLRLIQLNVNPAAAVQVLTSASTFSHQVFFIAHQDTGLAKGMCKAFHISPEMFLARRRFLEKYINKLQCLTSCNIYLLDKIVVVVGPLQGLVVARRMITAFITRWDPRSSEIDILGKRAPILVPATRMMTQVGGKSILTTRDDAPGLKSLITSHFSRPAKGISIRPPRRQISEMAEEKETHIPRVKLGNQGFEVSKLGFRCIPFALPGINSPVAIAAEECDSIIKEAFDQGITFFDTSDVNALHFDQMHLGKVLKQLPMRKVQLAAKSYPLGMDIDGAAYYVDLCLENTLRHLDVDCIDLYYHNVMNTPSVPIEEIMDELKKHVEYGNIKYVGLSEASPDIIRRAHAVHPITAVQLEWSLWTREEEIVLLCRELGIGLVASSPFGGCQFFGAKVADKSSPSITLLLTHPWVIGGNLEKRIYGRMENLAFKRHCTINQLALAWVLHQGDDVVPVTGTTKIKNLKINRASMKLKLEEEDLKEISDAYGRIHDLTRP